MKKEETDLLKRCGTENPFTVPEGYFECFTEQLIEKLPERICPFLAQLSR